MHFKIEPPQTQPEAHIHKASLRKGGCGGMQTIEEKNISLNEALEITRTDLVPNEDYYIKIERDPNCAQCNAQGGAFYGLCVERQPIIIVDNNLYTYAEIFQDTIVHIVWDKNSNSSINKYVIEKSIDGINFMPVASIEVINAVDILTLPASVVNPFGNIMYTSEKNSGFIYNEINLNFNQFFSLRYRVRMNTGTSIIYSNIFSPVILKKVSDDLPPIKIFEPCPQIGTPPVGWINTGFTFTESFFEDDGKCCINTYTLYASSLPLPACTPGPCFGNPTTPKKDCLCYCTYDECCKHLCNPDNTQGGYLACSCGPWKPCNGAVDDLVWIVTSVIDFSVFSVIPEDPVICAGQSITLSLNPGNLPTGIEIEWTNTGETTPSITVNPTTTTTYEAIVYNSDCFSILTTTVTVISVNASITVSGGISNCINASSVILSANSCTGCTYLWSNGATSQNITATQSGTYFVTVSNSGCSGIASVPLTFAPSVDLGPDQSFCGSGIITANVTGGIPPYSFAWNINNQSQTANVSAGGTYSVMVFDANGCTDNDNINVTINPLPIANAGPDQTICAGTTATATATASSGTSPYTYKWSTGATSQTISGLTAGTYKVTVTDINGCKDDDDVTIIVSSLPLAEFTGHNNDCEKTIDTYTVTNAVPGVTYAWTVTNGTPGCTLCTSTNVIWTIPQNGTGTITLTATDANGCAKSTTLTVFSCCKELGRTDLSNKKSSNYPTPMVNRYIAINGIFTIEPPGFTFQDCDIMMGPEAQIIILPNASLTCTTTATPTIPTKLYAGCNYMWDGIFLSSNTSSLTITSAGIANRTTVQDAKNAVVSKNGGNYSITKSSFVNNLRSIVQQNDAGNEVIRGNGFSSINNSLKPYYINNTVNNSQRAISFIELTNVPGINIGATGIANANIFNYADLGILSIGSSATIINNQFQNITLINPFTGTSIFSFAGSSSNASLTVGGNTASKNTFANCHFGVFAWLKQNLTVNTNSFSNVRNGISATAFGSNARTINILGNTMTNFEFGIALYDVPVCTLKVNGNTLTQNNSTYATGAGIRVWNSLSFKGQVFLMPEIKSNTLLGTQGSYTGISAINVTNAQIRLNQLTLPHSNNIPANITIYGIRVENTGTPRVMDSTVKRTSILPDVNVSNKLYGISMENSAKARVGINTVQRMGSGIRGFQNCGKTKFYCNSLYKCYNGFFFEQASISDQGGLNAVTSDNTWVDLSGNVGDRILYNITNANIKWFYKSSPQSNDPTFGAGVTPQFGSQILVFAPTTGMSGCGDLQKKESATPEEREQLFGDIVRDERIFNEHEPEFKFTEREFAFRSLKEDGFLQLGAPDDALFQNFVDTTDLTNKGKLNEVRKAIEQNDLLLAETKNASIASNNILEENVLAPYKLDSFFKRV